MFGWCDFYHTEIGYNFSCPCGNEKECLECSAFHNLTIKNNDFEKEEEKKE